MVNKLRQMSLRQRAILLAVASLWLIFALLLVITLAWTGFVIYVQRIKEQPACATPTAEEVVMGQPDCPGEEVAP